MATVSEAYSCGVVLNPEAIACCVGYVRSDEDRKRLKTLEEISDLTHAENLGLDIQRPDFLSVVRAANISGSELSVDVCRTARKHLCAIVRGRFVSYPFCISRENLEGDLDYVSESIRWSQASRPKTQKVKLINSDC